MKNEKGQKKKIAQRPRKKTSGPKRANGRVRKSLGSGMNKSAPMNYGGSIRTGNSMRSRGDGRVLVPNQGFTRTAVATVNGSTGFAVTKFEINPGLVGLFPQTWKQALLYDSYLFEKLVFRFVSSKSAASDGLITMGVDFDAADPNPSSMEQVQNYYGSVTNKVWENCDLNCDKADLNKFGVQRYIRHDVVADTDIKTYDVGNLYVATSGCADASQIGQLFVEHQVWLITPQMNRIGGDVVSEFIACSATAKATPFGTAVVTGALGVVPSVSTLTFPKIGYYLCQFSIDGTGVIAPVLSAGTATGNLMYGFAIDGASLLGSGVFLVNITAPNMTVVFDVSGSTTISQVLMRIVPYEMFLGEEKMILAEEASEPEFVKQPLRTNSDVVDFGRTRSITQGIAQMKMAGYPDHRSPLGPSRE